jgi:hypothetical protein
MGSELGGLHRYLLGLSAKVRCAVERVCSSPALAAKTTIATEFREAAANIRLQLEALEREFDREFKPEDEGARRSLAVASLPLVRAVQQVRASGTLTAAARTSKQVREMVVVGEDIRRMVENNVFEVLAPSTYMPDSVPPEDATRRARAALPEARRRLDALVECVESAHVAGQEALRSQDSV